VYLSSEPIRLFIDHPSFSPLARPNNPHGLRPTSETNGKHPTGDLAEQELSLPRRLLCLRSVLVTRRGSSQTPTASAKLIPCFCRFSRSLSGSCSKSTVQGNVYI
jgi:hypothetical protein